MSPFRRFDHDEARRLRAEGWTYPQIAQRSFVSPQAVARVCHPGEGRSYLLAGPLQDAIRRDINRCGQVRGVAARARLGGNIGSTERILRRILVQQRVSLNLADSYCTRMGHDLSEVYPDLYLDEAS